MGGPREVQTAAYFPDFVEEKFCDERISRVKAERKRVLNIISALCRDYFLSVNNIWVVCPKFCPYQMVWMLPHRPLGHARTPPWPPDVFDVTGFCFITAMVSSVPK